MIAFMMADEEKREVVAANMPQFIDLQSQSIVIQL
jgi:hypothetical protein